MKITNYNAVFARGAGVLLFGLPGAVYFLYGLGQWVTGGMAMDAESLKVLGGCFLGLAIALVFGFLAFTTDWSMELGEHDIRIRTLLRWHRYEWSQLEQLVMVGLKSKVAFGPGVDVTVNEKVQTAFHFKVDGELSAHEFLLTGDEVARLRQWLHEQGRSQLPGAAT